MALPVVVCAHPFVDRHADARGLLQDSLRTEEAAHPASHNCDSRERGDLRRNIESGVSAREGGREGGRERENSASASSASTCESKGAIADGINQLDVGHAVVKPAPTHTRCRSKQDSIPARPWFTYMSNGP